MRHDRYRGLAALHHDDGKLVVLRWVESDGSTAVLRSCGDFDFALQAAATQTLSRAPIVEVLQEDVGGVVMR